MTIRPELQDNEIGDLWSGYKPREGQDASTASIVALASQIGDSAGQKMTLRYWERSYLTRCAPTNI
jgi:hypothetical protein